ncbi:MAG: hypothetical protein Q6L60_15360 [Thermostichus sp. HHBFW_bins_43]
MTDEELNERFGRLVDAQLRFQEQLGDMAGILRQVVQRVDQVAQRMDQVVANQERHEQELQEFRQRQAETDQRFNVLLEEVRYLIRRQEPEPGSQGS